MATGDELVELVIIEALGDAADESEGPLGGIDTMPRAEALADATAVLTGPVIDGRVEAVEVMDAADDEAVTVAVRAEAGTAPVLDAAGATVVGAEAVTDSAALAVPVAVADGEALAHTASAVALHSTAAPP